MAKIKLIHQIGAIDTKTVPGNLGESSAVPTLIPVDEDLSGGATANALVTAAAVVSYVDTATAGQNQVSEMTDVTVTDSAANELLFTTSANTWVNYTLSQAGIQPALTFGISNGNAMKFASDAGAADDDFLRIKGTDVEGRSAAEVLGDIGAQAALTFGISDGNVIKCNDAVANKDLLGVNGIEMEGFTYGQVACKLGCAVYREEYLIGDAGEQEVLFAVANQANTFALKLLDHSAQGGPAPYGADARIGTQPGLGGSWFDVSLNGISLIKSREWKTADEHFAEDDGGALAAGECCILNTANGDRHADYQAIGTTGTPVQGDSLYLIINACGPNGSEHDLNDAIYDGSILSVQYAIERF